MNIKFLQDYRGVLTGERYFEKDAVVDLDDKENKDIDGKALIKDGRAKSGGTVKKAKQEEVKKEDVKE